MHLKRESSGKYLVIGMATEQFRIYRTRYFFFIYAGLLVISKRLQWAEYRLALGRQCIQILVGKLLGKFLAGRLRRWEMDNTESRLGPSVDSDVSSIMFKLYC
jgi:hypothetical protein